MDLPRAKERLRAIEAELPENAVVHFETFERDGRPLDVLLTERLRRAARKQGVWASPAMLTTLKNAAYGYDAHHARSAGGKDGIFRVDRTFRPANAMMAKLFDRFLDNGEGDALARVLGVAPSELLPVRLVSHHMRLLGVLVRGAEGDRLVLVDCDRE